jgi:hypothetical protein
MAHFQVAFGVSNPSPYQRTDYVQVDLDRLNVPPELDEASLTLYRLDQDGRSQPVPYQIDYPLGRTAKMRVLTFLACDIPSGPEDYSRTSATFLLSEREPTQSSMPCDLWIGYYYGNPQPGEPSDGLSSFSMAWHPDRPLDGIKLANGTIEMYLSLVSAFPPNLGKSKKGAVRSIINHQAHQFTYSGEMLSPFWKDPDVFWGRITQLVFFPLPWERIWFHQVNLMEERYQYKLVWAKSGPVRSIVVLKLGPIIIPYNGIPLLADRKEIQCDFYRMIYVYPRVDKRGDDKPFYMEELFVLTRDPRLSLSFRPYYTSTIMPPDIPTELRRFEHIPDYFIWWKHFGPHYRGYGFASDAHVRGVDIQGDRIVWRLPLTHHNRCVHYFLFMHELPREFDPFHIIGHNGWYEKVFKPLVPTEQAQRFPSPISYEEDSAWVE